MKKFLVISVLFLLLSACQSNFQHTDNGRTLEYKSGDKSLFTYNYTTVYPPAGVDSVYRRSGFFHPVNNMRGETLTNLWPSDHYHHYGLWYAWTKTTYDGKEIDFWNVVKRQGTVRFHEFNDITDSGFKATLNHIVYPDSVAEKIVMKENLEVKLGKISESGYYIDYITTLQCATNKQITLESYRYGGLVIRTREDWTPDRTDFMTSEGFTRNNADNTDARWAFFQGKTGQNDASILILSHPSNLNHPEPLRIWDEKANSGKGDMMWNFSPTKKQAYVLNTTDKLKLQYRIFIFDGLIDEKKANDLWENFANTSK